MLERHCARQGWTFEVAADLSSGMNDHKSSLKRLLDAVITHKDRLLRCGAELIFAICEAKNVELTSPRLCKTVSLCIRLRPRATGANRLDLAMWFGIARMNSSIGDGGKPLFEYQAADLLCGRLAVPL